MTASEVTGGRVSGARGAIEGPEGGGDVGHIDERCPGVEHRRLVRRQLRASVGLCEPASNQVVGDPRQGPTRALAPRS